MPRAFSGCPDGARAGCTSRATPAGGLTRERGWGPDDWFNFFYIDNATTPGDCSVPIVAFQAITGLYCACLCALLVLSALVASLSTKRSREGIALTVDCAVGVVLLGFSAAGDPAFTAQGTAVWVLFALFLLGVHLHTSYQIQTIKSLAKKSVMGGLGSLAMNDRLKAMLSSLPNSDEVDSTERLLLRLSIGCMLVYASCWAIAIPLSPAPRYATDFVDASGRFTKAGWWLLSCLMHPTSALIVLSIPIRHETTLFLYVDAHIKNMAKDVSSDGDQVRFEQLRRFQRNLKCGISQMVVSTITAQVVWIVASVKVIVGPVFWIPLILILIVIVFIASQVAFIFPWAACRRTLKIGTNSSNNSRSAHGTVAPGSPSFHARALSSAPVSTPSADAPSALSTQGSSSL